MPKVTNKIHIGPPKTTIGGKYAVGNTKTSYNYDVVLTEDEINKWRVGFDRIDTDKNGRLSLNEICDERDKQIKDAKRAMYDPLFCLTHDIKNLPENIKAIKKEELITEQYRENRGNSIFTQKDIKKDKK